MHIGAHISIAGGVFHAPENAYQIGCESFQMFTRSPRGGKAPDLTPEIVSEFKVEMKKYKLKNIYVHAPYFINFASARAKVFKGSVEVLREELDRSSKLGVRALMTHLGSAKDFSREKSIKMTADGIKSVLKNYKGTTQFLIENAAGTGNILGDSFAEIAEIIRQVEMVKINKNKVGICLDTCHAFASGYDVRNKKAWDELLQSFDKIIGLNRLVVIHANDSKYDFNEHKDRHDNLGNGFIGKKGFVAMFSHPKLKKVDVILETPWVAGEKTIKRDIILAKKMRQA